jgi:Glycosyltransferase family 87
MLTRKELRGQLVVLASVIWIATVANCSRPGPFLRTGQLKGTDFVQFYTSGALLADGALTADWQARYAAQVRYVPDSKGLIYPPLYGPQVAALFLPLSRLPYLWALGVWLALNVLAYAAVVELLRRRLLADAPRDLVWLAAAAFPAFWSLVDHGQCSMIALGAFALCTGALLDGRRGLAGLALGILAYKPSLFAPALALLVLAAEWRMAVGAMGGAVLYLALGLVLGGWSGFVQYLEVLRSLPAWANTLAVKPYQMHSLRAFWMLLVPTRAVDPLYAVSAAAVLVMSASAWRRSPKLDRRAALLPLTVVLVSPHLYLYDLLILGPTFFYLAGATSLRDSRAVVPLMAAFLSPFTGPLAGVIRVQISVVANLVLLWQRFVARSGSE